MKFVLFSLILCSSLAFATVQQSPAPSPSSSSDKQLPENGQSPAVKACESKDSTKPLTEAANPPKKQPESSQSSGEKENGKEKYFHSWDSGKKPPLSTLKMVCKDLSDLKTGDYVYITVQGKDEVYELTGTEFGREGSVYKVERNNDCFSFKHPATSGFLFFTNPSYYIGVKKDSDALEMFHNTEGQETAFNLLFHEKLNGFVMKNLSEGKCMTVCEKLFGHTPCFRKDQCAAVRLYKIPAYSLQKTNLPEVKPTDKTTKEEQLRKIKEEKEAAINTAKSVGRGQSTALAPTVTEEQAASQIKEVKVIKKVVVHKKPHKESATNTCKSINTAASLGTVCRKCPKGECICAKVSIVPVNVVVSSTASTTVTSISSPSSSTATSTKTAVCETSTAIVIVHSSSTIPTSTLSKTLHCTSVHNATQTTSLTLVGYNTSTIIAVKPTTVMIFTTKTMNVTQTSTLTNTITKTIAMTTQSFQTSILTAVKSITSTCMLTPTLAASQIVTKTSYTTETIEACE